MDLDFDGYLEYFKSDGFKLVKETQEGGVKEATLRLYTPENYGEVMLRYKEGDVKVSVLLSMNGKVVPFA